MSTPAYQLPPHANPIGTPNPVMPTAPNQPMLPGQNAGMNGYQAPNQGVAYVQGQTQPQAQPGTQQPTNEMLSRPEILEQIVNQQNAAADPQAMAEQANQQRIEALIAEQNQRSAQQADQLNQAVTLLAQSQQQQATFQQQQVEMQQAAQRQAEQQRLAAERRPWEDPNLQLDADTQQVFEDSLPVMDVVSRRNALQASHETVQNIVTPEIQALQQKIDALASQVNSNTQVQQQSFADQLVDLASEHGLDLNTLDGEPDYIALKQQTSNAITGQTIGADVTAALAGGQTKDLRILKQVFKTLKELREGTPQAGGANELPPQVGGSARVDTANAAAQPGNAGQLTDFQQQEAELEGYRSHLSDQLRRQKIDVATFQTEIAKVEQGMNALISQAQQPT